MVNGQVGGEPSVYSKKYQTVRIKPALIKQ